MDDFFTLFAWFVLAILFFVVVAAIVALGSLPKKIALKRNHPQVDAINACSWIGLALAGIGWPIAFVWAFLRSGAVGYAEAGQTTTPAADSAAASQTEVEQLRQRIAELENKFSKHLSQEG